MSITPSLWSIVASRVGAWIETELTDCVYGGAKSHPVWVRGLKPREAGVDYMGVMSHPVWVRGLKRLKQQKDIYSNVVASRVGAWIETLIAFASSIESSVASRVGAWIETLCPAH